MARVQAEAAAMRESELQEAKAAAEESAARALAAEVARVKAETESRLAEELARVQADADRQLQGIDRVREEAECAAHSREEGF